MNAGVENGQTVTKSSKNKMFDKKINGQVYNKNANIKVKDSSQKIFKHQDYRKNEDEEEEKRAERDEDWKEDGEEEREEEEEEAEEDEEEEGEEEEYEAVEKEGGGYRLLKDERFVTEDLVGELRERLRRVDNPEGLVEATKEIDKKCSEFIEKIIKRVDKGGLLDENGRKIEDFKKFG